MKFSVQPLVKPLRTALLPLMAALVLAGCATVPSGLPEITTTAQFKEQGPTPPAGFTRAVPSEAQARGAWWLAFNDPTLNALVEQAAVSNTNIQAAAARLAEARALARSANADRLPQIGLSAGANRGAGLDKATASTTPATMTNIGATFSYEVDLFGRLSGASNAAKLDAIGREALLQSTRLAVQAEVAQTYLQLRALDAERALVREHGRGLPRHAAPVAAPRTGRRHRRARRGARADRGVVDRVGRARARPPARPGGARARSLSVSFYVAIASAVVFLVAVHKLEYFINARIIGGQIRARA